MAIRQQQGIRIKQQMKITIAALSTGMGIVLFLLYFGYFNTSMQEDAKASENNNKKISKKSGLSHALPVAVMAPVEKFSPSGSIISFTSTFDKNGNVVIKWETHSEQNSNYFTISRSDDNINFYPWKILESLGNSDQEQEYTTIDYEPIQGKIYYRLNRTDNRGRQEQFGSIKVQQAGIKKSRTKVTIDPNPFNDKITISLTAGFQGNSTIRIWNATGKLVLQESINSTDQDDKVIIENLDQLPAGTYLLRIFNGAIVSDGIKMIKS